MASQESTRSWDTVPQLQYELIQEPHMRKSKRFRRSETVIGYRLKHNIGAFANPFEVSEAIDGVFEEIMHPHLDQAGDNDLVSVGIQSANLTTDIFLPPRKKAAFRREDFLDTIFNIAQSNDKFLINGEFEITILVTKTLLAEVVRLRQ